MTKKLKLILSATLAALAALSLISGCKLGNSAEDIIKDKNLVTKVTYYANGGKFEDGRDYKELWCKENSKLINIGETTATVSGSVSVTRKNYTFVGWYPASMGLDADGEYQPLDENGDVIILKNSADSRKGIDVASYEVEGIVLDETGAVDFKSTVTEKDNNLYLVAVWKANVRLVTKLVIDDGVSITGIKYDDDYQPINGQSATYQNGDVINVYDFENEKVTNPGLFPLKAVNKSTPMGGTFYEYYYDEACSEVVSWPYQLTFNDDETEGDSEESVDKVIYAKYIVGDWTVLRSAKEVADCWSYNTIQDPEAKVWLFDDISCSGYTVQPKNLACEFKGNGYTISDLKVTQASIGNETTVSMFGDIASTAKISDVTFENITISYSSFKGNSASLYMFCNNVENGAQISNVKISASVTVGYKSGLIIDNFPYNADGTINLNGQYNNWISGYGTTDDDFFKAFDVTAYNSSLTIYYGSGSTDCQEVVSNYNSNGGN